MEVGNDPDAHLVVASLFSGHFCEDSGFSLALSQHLVAEVFELMAWDGAM